MDTSSTISFKVTASQSQTIYSRMSENGFDEVSTYIKIVALKMQEFSLTSTGSSTDVADVEFSFSVTQTQKEKIEANMEESKCKDLTTYLQYVALHSVVTAVVEVRSTGSLDAMLQRIAKQRNLTL